MLGRGTQKARVRVRGRGRVRVRVPVGEGDAEGAARESGEELEHWRHPEGWRGLLRVRVRVRG